MLVTLASGCSFIRIILRGKTISDLLTRVRGFELIPSINVLSNSLCLWCDWNVIQVG